MKSRDQILLEGLYGKILSETDSMLDSVSDDELSIDVNKIIHDIFNKIQPYLFDFSGDEFKLKFKEILEKIIEKLNSRIEQI